MYRDEVCVIDWKTSLKPRPTLKDIHDYPLQSIAYAGAINDDNNYPFNVSILASLHNRMTTHVVISELYSVFILGFQIWESFGGDNWW